MLVLSRKRNEQIVIGDNVTITVVEIRGDEVRLGVKAPREVPVHRSEVALILESSPERVEKIRRLRKNGVPLWRIEQMLDDEDSRSDE